MPAWSPPSIPRHWLVAVALLSVLWLAYAFLVLQQILLGLIPLIAFAAVYVGWRFLAAFEAIADAQQRLAARREGDEE